MKTIYNITLIIINILLFAYFIANGDYLVSLVCVIGASCCIYTLIDNTLTH